MLHKVLRLSPFLPTAERPEDRAAWEAQCVHLTVTWWPWLGLGIALAALLWWPLDWLLYEPDSAARSSLAWMRGTLIVLDVALALLLPRFTGLYRFALPAAATAAALNFAVAGWALGGLDDGGVLGLTFSFAAPLFSLLLLLPPGKRLVANLVFFLALLAGWIAHPMSHLSTPGVLSSVSYLAFVFVLASFLGHALFASIRHSFQLGRALERQRADLAKLAAGLEAEVASQTRSIRALHAAARQDRTAQRQQVARDMHDGLGQELLSLRLLVGLGRQLHPQPGVQDTLTEMDAQVERLQKSLRQLLLTLRPSLEGGLAEALSALAADLERRSGLEIRVEVGPMPQLLDSERDGAVYRIAQEALVNALRHARAKRITLTLEQRSGVLYMQIQDDGVGIPASKVGSGLGTLGIQERAQDLGGRVSWSGEQGTLLSFELPL